MLQQRFVNECSSPFKSLTFLLFFRHVHELPFYSRRSTKNRGFWLQVLLLRLAGNLPYFRFHHAKNQDDPSINCGNFPLLLVNPIAQNGIGRFEASRALVRAGVQDWADCRGEPSRYLCGFITQRKPASLLT